jgi:membrane-bound ClpP family serine protease
VGSESLPVLVPLPRHDQTAATTCQELSLIILGVILLIIGFVAKIAILWTIGIVVVVIGAILALLGMAGHAVGGRRHYF